MLSAAQKASRNKRRDPTHYRLPPPSPFTTRTIGRVHITMKNGGDYYVPLASKNPFLLTVEKGLIDTHIRAKKGFK